jgi:hypothetical protein
VFPLAIGQKKESALRFKSLNGVDFELSIPTGRQINPAPFFLSVHKAGSSMQSAIVESVCSRFGIAFLNIAAQLFDRGLGPENCGMDALYVLEQNYVCTGFREVCLLDRIERYWSAPKLLLLRDPRDIAVSLYFSVLNHPVPLQDGPVKKDILGARKNAIELGISDFVLAGIADDILNNMRSFLDQAAEIPNFTICRYEDIVFNKREWISEIAQQLQVALPGTFLDELLQQFDVFPTTENPTAFIRKVVPGDYLNRLNSKALEYIETAYRDVLDRLDYPLSSNGSSR